MRAYPLATRAIAILALNGVALAQTPSHTPQIVPHTATVTKTTDLDYLLYLPENYAESDTDWPLLFWLHGDGGQADRGGFEEIRSYGPPALIEQGQDIPAIVVAPQLWGNISWDADILHHLLQTVLERYRVNPDRIYLMGYSRGGFGAWELGARYPAPFAAVVVVSGRGMNSIESLRHAAVWIFHGELDEGVPVADARSMFNELKAAGGDVQLTIYPDIGHNALTPALKNEELWKWLFAQERSPDPKTLPIAELLTRAKRCESLTIEGEITMGKVVEIHTGLDNIDDLMKLTDADGNPIQPYSGAGGFWAAWNIEGSDISVPVDLEEPLRDEGLREQHFGLWVVTDGWTESASPCFFVLEPQGAPSVNWDEIITRLANP